MPLRAIHKFRLVIGLLALILPALALIAIVLGVVLFRYDVLGLDDGQLWLAASASVGGLALLVLIGGRAAKWLSWRWALLLAIPAALPIAAGAWALDYLNTHPSTAEVSTDLIDPPPFMGPGARPFPEAMAVVSRQRHAGVRSLTVPLQPGAAYDHALKLAESRPGWRVTVAKAPETFQGTAVFGRFRYQRDWVIRVRPELTGGALIDMRLRSRPGEPDLGDNAQSVQGFLSEMKSAKTINSQASRP